MVNAVAIRFIYREVINIDIGESLSSKHNTKITVIGGIALVQIDINIDYIKIRHRIFEANHLVVRPAIKVVEGRILNRNIACCTIEPNPIDFGVVHSYVVNGDIIRRSVKANTVISIISGIGTIAIYFQVFNCPICIRIIRIDHTGAAAISLLIDTSSILAINHDIISRFDRTAGIVKKDTIISIINSCIQNIQAIDTRIPKDDPLTRRKYIDIF